MSTSTMKTRILFKTDTKENWDLQEYNFQTLKGELYFYTDYLDSGKINHQGEKIYIPQLKIGDGSSPLSKIVFVKNDYITNSQIDALFNLGSSDSSILGRGTLGSFILGKSTSTPDSATNILDSAILDSIILD